MGRACRRLQTRERGSSEVHRGPASRGAASCASRRAPAGGAAWALICSCVWEASGRMGRVPGGRPKGRRPLRGKGKAASEAAPRARGSSQALSTGWPSVHAWTRRAWCRSGTGSIPLGKGDASHGELSPQRETLNFEGRRTDLELRHPSPSPVLSCTFIVQRPLTPAAGNAAASAAASAAAPPP